MSRRVWFISVIAIAIVSLAGAFVLLRPGERQVISTAASPDGTWSVAVLGQPQWTGGYEIIVEVRDGKGQVAPGGAFVVGLTRDLVAAERTFVISFIDNNRARVGSRTLDKAAYFEE